MKDLQTKFPTLTLEECTAIEVQCRNALPREEHFLLFSSREAEVKAMMVYAVNPENEHLISEICDYVLPRILVAKLTEELENEKWFRFVGIGANELIVYYNGKLPKARLTHINCYPVIYKKIGNPKPL